jgi:hypothetical protein
MTKMSGLASVRRGLRVWLSVGGLSMLSACVGSESLQATFTSRVVQLDSCRVVGEGDEGCEREEEFSELRVELMQVDANTWWLLGVPRSGVKRGALLGSTDTTGGMLFVDAYEQTNRETGCVLTVKTELALRIDPDRIADVGDPCVALVGRQVDETLTTAQCDDVNVPPAAVARIVRRRWEPLSDASACQ